MNPQVQTPLPLRTTQITPPGTPTRTESFEDVEGLFAQRYDARPGTVYLLRPDQHVAARWRNPDAAAIRAALDRALAGEVRSEAVA